MKKIILLTLLILTSTFALGYNYIPTEPFQDYVSKRPVADKSKLDKLKLLGIQNNTVVQYSYSSAVNSVTTELATNSINGIPGAVAGFASYSSANVRAINAHIQSVNAKGGGNVIIPLGTFTTNKSIQVLSNVTLIGYGYGSHIDNIAASGFSKNTVITGNVGDMGGSTSLFNETRYNVNAIAQGNTSVTFVSSGNVSTFNVGDIVAVMSYETYVADTRYPISTNLNVVTAKNGSVLSLKYAIPDTYNSSSGYPTISRVSGAVNGYDGLPLWMAQNATVENLRLTNKQGLASGWYAIFASGLNNNYSNIYADNCSGVIGGNSLAHSKFSNIKGNFDLRGIDLSDIQDSIVLEDIDITRNGINSLLSSSALGVALHDGQDIIVNRLRADLGSNGQASMLYTNRGKFSNCTITHAGAGVNVGVLLGYGFDMEANSCNINGSDRDGVYIVGERAKVKNCTILNPGLTGTFYGIHIKSTVVEYTVSGNYLGVAGSRGVNDDVIQDIAISGSAIIKDNMSVSNSGGVPLNVVDSNYIDTAGSTSPVTLKTYNIAGGSTRPAVAYLVTITGLRNGSTGTKQVNLLLNATPVATINYGASDQSEWTISAIVTNAKNSTLARVTGKGYLGAALQYSQYQSLTGAYASNATLTLQATCASSSDLIAVYQFIVQPIY